MAYFNTKTVRRGQPVAAAGMGDSARRIVASAGAIFLSALLAGGCAGGSPTSPSPVPETEPAPAPTPAPALQPTPAPQPNPAPTPVPTPTAEADLVISNINFSPGSPRAGDEITFWVFVRNEGNAPAAASTLRFQVGGESNPPETAVPALAPGQEYRHERQVTLNVAQSYMVTATADALDQVAESDETNNVLARTFTVAQALGQPDLVIRLINLSPGAPRAGDEITFWVFVKNEGNAQAAASTLRFQVGGESNPPQTAVPTLAPGQEYRHERQVTLNTAQNYMATATADALDQVAESDETNNVLARTFTVAQALGQPDLVVRLINFSPGAPRAGDEITFWVFVKNEGNAQAAASTLRFQVGGESNPPQTAVPTLAPGQEYRHERKVTLNTAQNYMATATADALHQVTESDETNNVRTRSFSVGS